MADVVVFMSLQFTMPPLELVKGESKWLEKCGIKVIHVMFRYFLSVYKNKLELDRKRHVIEQKLREKKNSAQKKEKLAKQKI